MNTMVLSNLKFRPRRLGFPAVLLVCSRPPPAAEATQEAERVPTETAGEQKAKQIQVS